MKRAKYWVLRWMCWGSLPLYFEGWGVSFVRYTPDVKSAMPFRTRQEAVQHPFYKRQNIKVEAVAVR